MSGLLVAKTSQIIIRLVFFFLLLLLVWVLEEHIFYFYFPSSVWVLFNQGDLAAFMS